MQNVRGFSDFLGIVLDFSESLSFIFKVTFIASLFGHVFVFEFPLFLNDGFRYDIIFSPSTVQDWGVVLIPSESVSASVSGCLYSNSLRTLKENSILQHIKCVHINI